MSQSISVRREGDVIILEDRERTPQDRLSLLPSDVAHSYVLKSIVLDADNAIWLGNQLLGFGFEIKGESR